MKIKKKSKMMDIYDSTGKLIAVLAVEVLIGMGIMVLLKMYFQ